MTVSAPPPADRILRSIVSTVVAMTCFAILNAMSKTLSTSGYPVIQVIWARYIFAFIFMLAMFLPRNGMGLFTIRRLETQIVRGLLLFFSSYFYFHGVVYLPLATAASISLSSPLIVTALSSRLLGEPVGPRRWAAVAVGFIGALIIVRPGHADFDWHILWVVASTVCSAFYQLFSRRYGQTERPDASATLATIVGTLAASPFVPFEWAMPASTWHLVLFVGMGVMAGAGHYFLTIAYSQAPAAVVSPFNYTQLIGAAVLGFFVFDETPDEWTWIGATVIIASGLYIGYRERVRYRRKLTSQS
ncbi:DMT family transporter [Reyranella sp.]|jgi:drug/metabolite transporter (DMT)-like permease|uniref:DMT family transporter n=1 Tax=Reyranella sp. TaxID=1929291 RepID=UPI002F946F6A